MHHKSGSISTTRTVRVDDDKWISTAHYGSRPDLGVARPCPLAIARENREKKLLENPEAAADVGEPTSKIVHTADVPLWSRWTSFERKPPPLSAGALTTMTSMNMHSETRMEPRLSKRLTDPIARRMGYVSLHAFLLVNCPLSFDFFTRTQAASILAHGALRSVKLSIDWTRHIIVITRILEGDEVSKRKLWLGNIVTCNDSPDVVSHLISTGVTSDLIDFDRLHFCGLYTKTETRPIFVLFEGMETKEHLITLLQHTIEYFKNRMEDHVRHLRNFGRDCDLEVFRDVTVRDILTSVLASNVETSDAGCIPAFTNGIGSCTIVFGPYIQRNATVRFNLSTGKISVAFEGNSETAEILPQGILAERDDSIIKELKSQKEKSFLKVPDFFVFDHAKTVWSPSELDKLEGLVTVERADWWTPLLFSFPSMKKAGQFVGIVKSIGRADAIVNSASVSAFECDMESGTSSICM